MVLVVLVSYVNQEITKLDPTRIGQRRNKATRTYHQWMYSFKKRKKYQVKRMAVTKTVMIPIVTAPHLIGKHPQHEDSLVNSLEHTHSQQQHGARIGLAYGSSPSSSFFSSSFLGSSFFSLFFPADFSDFLSAGYSSGLSAPSAASSAPPSSRYSYSSPLR